MPDTETPGFLEARLALVAGADRGSGAAAAEALAREGAHVVLVGRDAAGLEAVEDRIHARDGSATLAPADLAEPEAVARLAAAMGRRWHALDILVLAGTMPDSKLQQALISSLETMLRRSPGARILAVDEEPQGADSVIELLRRDFESGILVEMPMVANAARIVPPGF